LQGEGKSHSVIGVPFLAAARALGLACATATLLTLGACQKPAGEPAAANSTADVSGYLEPPVMTGAVREADGRVTLTGRAPIDTEVRLMAPGGGAFSATATAAGDWSIQLAASPEPRMFAFDGEIAGRVLHAEGAVLVLPSPGPAAVLMRAGYGAAPIGSGGGPFRIEAIDYDGSGGVAVSGVAAPRAMLRFVLDGAPAGAGQADDKGRFTVLDMNTRTPMGQGAHTVRIEGQTTAVHGPLTIAAPTDLSDRAFASTRELDGWRIDWRIPGGGTQGTLVFDAASPAPLIAAPSGGARR